MDEGTIGTRMPTLITFDVRKANNNQNMATFQTSCYVRRDIIGGREPQSPVAAQKETMD